MLLWHDKEQRSLLVARLLCVEEWCFSSSPVFGVSKKKMQACACRTIFTPPSLPLLKTGSQPRNSDASAIPTKKKAAPPFLKRILAGNFNLSRKRQKKGFDFEEELSTYV